MRRSSPGLIGLTVILIALICVGVCFLVHWYDDVNRSVTYTRLSTYAYQGNDVAIEMMLTRGADVNFTLEKGNAPTVLASAVDGRHAATVRLLLGAGANPNATAAGLSPLYGAIRHGDTEIIKALLDHGAHIDERCLVKAIQGRNPALLALLLSSGGDPNVLLWSAAKSGDVALLRLSLAAATARARRDPATSPKLMIGQAMSLAKRNGHANVVRILEAYRRQSADRAK